MNYYDQVAEAAAFIKARLGGLAPRVGIVLGSAGFFRLGWNSSLSTAGGQKRTRRNPRLTRSSWVALDTVMFMSARRATPSPTGHFTAIEPRSALYKTG